MKKKDIKLKKKAVYLDNADLYFLYSLLEGFSYFTDFNKNCVRLRDLMYHKLFFE